MSLKHPETRQELIAAITQLRSRNLAFSTIGLDLHAFDVGALAALFERATAEANVTRAARARHTEQDAARYAATHQSAEQVQARAAERVVNLRARQRAIALKNDERRHSVRPVATPEPPLAA